MNTAKRHRRTIALNRGFTLIEVMMSVAILAFGIVSIYEALFVSVDTYSYYTHYLSTQDWISEKIWKVQEELMITQELKSEQTSGQIVRNHKTFDWVMAVSQLDEAQGLYKVNVTLFWNEGEKQVSISREAYLLPSELKKYNEEGSV